MEPIAIIGIGCRFPGAPNPQRFWQLLRDGMDAITEVPSSRWSIDQFYDSTPGTSGKMSTRWGGFLDQIDQFEPQFFGISPREAVSIDPQQRLLLEVAWEALEDAGYRLNQLTGSETGVFVGVSSSDYRQLFQGEYDLLNAYMGTGNAFSIIANRLSYWLNLRGPSLAVDTACSSSLVAVHLACQSLRSGESDRALAGGVNVILSPELTIVFSQAQMMAADGRCKTLDAKANGYVRGEGCGIVVLKRLSDAIADHDRILAVIRGSAVNQDGHSNGLTAPNGLSQQVVVRRALANAAVSSAQISYVELHGTGTPLGDPIEAEAIGTVLAQGRSVEQPCAVGSVKTNIGHLEAAAGIAGLIKVTLALQQRQLPPSLHFSNPNPYIPLEKLRLKVQQTLEPWQDSEGNYLAGVSSFGFGGTNAHLILSAVSSDLLSAYATPTDATPTDATPTCTTHTCTTHNSCPGIVPPYLLPLSTRNPAALPVLVENYINFVHADRPNLADLCYTASMRRQQHEHRLAVVFHDHADLIEKLQAAQQQELRVGVAIGSVQRQAQRNRQPRLCFVFSGQGSQWWGMGCELGQQEPVFRAALEKCDQELRQYAPWSLLDELMAPESETRLQETEVAQPVLFAIQVALTALWQSWGIEPTVVIGHSVGEITAAYISGGLTLAEAIRIVYHRSLLMQQATGNGKMAAMELSVAEAQQYLVNQGLANQDLPSQGLMSSADKQGDRLSIAAINSPNSIVLSGEETALAAVIAAVQKQQRFCRLLPVNYAFHCAQMDIFQEQLEQAIQGITPKATRIPMISTVTGQTIAGEALTPQYWGRNMREPVNFAGAIAELLLSNDTHFLEISPHPVLGMNIRQCMEEITHQSESSAPMPTGAILSSLRKQENERFSLLKSLGSLYTLGFSLNWQSCYPAPLNCISLPTYPWQRQRYWFKDTTRSPAESTLETRAITSESGNPSARLADKSSLKPASWRISRSQLLAQPESDRRPQLESYLRQLFAQVLGIAADQFEAEQLLYTLGLDSLMVVELSNYIQADLEIKIPLDYFAGLSITQFVTQVLIRLEAQPADQTDVASLSTVPRAVPRAASRAASRITTDRIPSTLETGSGHLSSVQRSTQASSTAWRSHWRSSSQAQFRLFCFPYAGTGASCFRQWFERSPTELEICPIQLPGREERLTDAPFTRLPALIKALIPILQPYLDRPFAFFGHSLGALIAFECIRELERSHLPEPIHLFVSGARAPQIFDLNSPIHRLPDSQFLDALRQLQGTPEELLQDSQGMSAFLPVLRADFALLETYFYSSRTPLNCPITAFGGKQDTQVSLADLEAWQVQTQASFNSYLFSGDHFFLRQDYGGLLDRMAQSLIKTTTLVAGRSL